MIYPLGELLISGGALLLLLLFTFELRSGLGMIYPRGG